MGDSVQPAAVLPCHARRYAGTEGERSPAAAGIDPKKYPVDKRFPAIAGTGPLAGPAVPNRRGDGTVLPGGGEDDSKRGLLSSAAFMGNEGDGSHAGITACAHAGWGKEGGGSRKRLTSDSLAGQMLQ